jgi:catechol 2,3-dioxygenase-like lactoylglutathione lyase family enzyme
MEEIIAKLVGDFEQGRLTRRQLIQSLALTTATVAGVAPAAAAEGSIMKAQYFNHVSYQVTDYAKTRDFYASVFGMKVTNDDGKQCRLEFGQNILIARSRPNTPKPSVDHIAYTVENWDKQKGAIKEEFKRRGIALKAEGDSSYHVMDPDGFNVQFGGLKQ